MSTYYRNPEKYKEYQRQYRERKRATCEKLHPVAKGHQSHKDSGDNARLLRRWFGVRYTKRKPLSTG